MKKYKTSNEWYSKFKLDNPGSKIFDYDGWRNHRNGPCIFMTDLITEKDFNQRLISCTMKWKNK